MNNNKYKFLTFIEVANNGATAQSITKIVIPIIIALAGRNEPICREVRANSDCLTCLYIFSKHLGNFS